MTRTTGMTEHNNVYVEILVFHLAIIQSRDYLTMFRDVDKHSHHGAGFKTHIDGQSSH